MTIPTTREVLRTDDEFVDIDDPNAVTPNHRVGRKVDLEKSKRLDGYLLRVQERNEGKLLRVPTDLLFLHYIDPSIIVEYVRSLRPNRRPGGARSLESKVARTIAQLTRKSGEQQFANLAMIVAEQQDLRPGDESVPIVDDPGPRTKWTPAEPIIKEEVSLVDDKVIVIDIDPTKAMRRERSDILREHPDLRVPEKLWSPSIPLFYLNEGIAIEEIRIPGPPLSLILEPPVSQHV